MKSEPLHDTIIKKGTRHGGREKFHRGGEWKRERISSMTRTAA